MSKKVIRQIKALERFTIRTRSAEETEEAFLQYLQRKEQERQKLLKAKSSYHGTF